MLDYRFTALLLPVCLLLFVLTLAAYPWQIPIGNGLALPFLTLLIILFCALRYPGLMASPLVFASGLACDLLTRSALGYWTILFLVTLLCARSINLIVVDQGRLVGYLCTGFTLSIICASAWGLASLYRWQWLDLYLTLEAMTVALLLLPLPALFLVGLENLLILKNEQYPSNYFDRGK